MRPVPGTVSPSQESCGPADTCSQDADDSVLKLPRALGVAILCVHRGGDRGSEGICEKVLVHEWLENVWYCLSHSTLL